LGLDKLSSLKTRILSSLVLLPSALLIIWLGGWYFVGFLSVLSLLIVWELIGLSGTRIGLAAVVTMFAGAAVPFAFLFFGIEVAAAVGLFGLGLCITIREVRQSENRTFLGSMYTISITAMAAFAWLRERPEEGLVIVLWLLTVVAVTDIAAYLVGSTLKGPKLAPKLSPNKTWSGLIGGCIGAAAVGAFWAYSLEHSLVGWVIGLSACMAVVAQMGYLMESSLKRRFGVKDTSNLIPGHGGILDRFDGHLTAGPLAALIAVYNGGSLLTWP